MAFDGLDETLKLEAVYFSAPIPRNFAVLTVLGAVFDKVYFPGVYLPKSGFDVAELDKEIERIEALPIAQHFDTRVLTGVMKLTKYARMLEGFCEFTADPDDPFGNKTRPPSALIKAVDEAIHGPPRPGLIPDYTTGHCKVIPGSEENILYPGIYDYLARAIVLSGETGVPLLNDFPEIPIPGVSDRVPTDNAKLLATIIAIECTKLVLPATPVLRPEDIMEFRSYNAPLLRAFRRSMLRYAADLNCKIKDVTSEEFGIKTKFFVETEIVPAMDELNVLMNDPARPWHKRAISAIKIIPEIGGAFLAGGPTAALTKAITAYATQFFVELAAKGDKEEAIKRSGLTYLMRLRAASKVPSQAP
jgi:hypothetical protein